MYIKSFGDQITTGNYSIHSKFERVINFIDGNNLVSLVDETIGAGPVNIVIDNFLRDNTSSIVVDKKSVQIGGKNFVMLNDIIYHSQVGYPSVDYSSLIHQVEITENLLIELAHPKSLVFLLDKEREKNFRSGFEKEYINKIKNGAEKVFNGNLIEGSASIKGLGFGLTPSGDDFIAGMLIALYMLENINRENLSETRNEIYKNSKTENLISNTFIRLASEGRLQEKHKNFIESLTIEKDDIENSIKQLLSIGETSGADFLTGFILTIKNYSNICQ